MSEANFQQRKRYSRWMYALMWLGVLLLLVLFFQDQLHEQYNPNQKLAQQQDTADGVVLQRNKQGHYVASGLINGQDVVFLLDTGATDVAIPEHLAKQLGLRYGRAGQVNTANGVSRTFDTMLDSLSLGSITQRQVPAVIVPGFESQAILLGMSFLKHIEFSQRGDTLTLRP
jgi:aspartyl protease family protein